MRAGDATVVAVGTEFNVRRGSDRAVVSVTHGRVLVEPETRILPAVLLQEFKPKLRPVPLVAGQQTMVGSSGAERATTIDAPSVATSWRSGQLTFRMEPLRYVLEDVNRYAPKPIVLDDDSLGTLQITGSARTSMAGSRVWNVRSDCVRSKSRVASYWRPPSLGLPSDVNAAAGSTPLQSSLTTGERGV